MIHANATFDKHNTAHLGDDAEDNAALELHRTWHNREPRYELILYWCTEDLTFHMSKAEVKALGQALVRLADTTFLEGMGDLERLNDAIADAEPRVSGLTQAEIDKAMAGPQPTAVEEYAAWLARQPKPKTMAEALNSLDDAEAVLNALAEAVEKPRA